MKSLRLERWGASILPLSTRPTRSPQYTRDLRYSIRWQTAAVAPYVSEKEFPGDAVVPSNKGPPRQPDREKLPSPDVSQASQSAKLSALHARLGLNSTIPIETLARSLVHPTADPDPRFNNLSFATLGNDLMGYYTTEQILCNYPRLPMAVLQAAQYAYVGPRALTAVAQSWGVEVTAEPGGEVDPGLLQFRRARPGATQEMERRKNPDKPTTWRERAYDKLNASASPNPTPAEDPLPTTTLELATTSFVRSIIGSIYLHRGGTVANTWFHTHIISPRPLDMSRLFTFTQPTRDLSRLCAREGFEAPVARLESESGRLSRHPVFVVGVYSGRDKLGEAEGSSLDEARFRAAVRALKGWYLYSPIDKKMLPSESEGKGPDFKFKSAVIDDGEIIV